MKLNKQIFIILVLTSLLFSSLGFVYYFYTLNKKTMISNDQQRVVLVAARDIDKNTKITNKDLKTYTIAKKYILSTPLTQQEIVGKYAKEHIYTNDIFRKEKISIKSMEDNLTDNTEKYKFNSYNISLKHFRNPNYTLKKDDIINIVSVYPAPEVKTNKSPNSVQYVANKIRVLGFLIEGKKSDIAIKKVIKTTIVKKEEVKSSVELKADEILLDINNKTLLSLIDDYNRGNQLWMVKTLPLAVKTVKPEKKIVYKKMTYPTRLYVPKEKFSHLKASIHYGDDKEAAVINNKTVKTDMAQSCKNSDKYIFAISNRVHLRTGPTTKYRISRIVYRNYIIPYTETINKDWFKTCDGYYIHKNEVKEITKDEALKRLGQ